VAEVHGTGAPVDSHRLLAHILTGGERTFLQDPGFGIRQLADTAIRALSPAVNDPTTACQAVDRITDLLASVASSPDPSGWYLGADGTVRVRRHDPTFADLCELGFTEIIRYGADAPQVTRRLLASFALLADLASEDHRTVLGALRRTLDDAAVEDTEAPFRDMGGRPDPLGLG